MMRIQALNEDSNSSSNEDHVPEVTKEAQETIAIAEYHRALTFKKNNRSDHALSLFLELLETQVLHDVTPESNKKLFSVKCNCYRNVGLIYEEQGDKRKALDNLRQNIILDDTDIYILNKAGHLALFFEEIELAMVLFQKCHEINPNHWPSGDGLLQVICAQLNFMDAYGWALHLHKKDPDYERAIMVLIEIHDRFGSVVRMFEDMFKGTFDYEKYKHIKIEESCFKSKPFTDPAVRGEIQLKDITPYKVTELTWSSVGDIIIYMYEDFKYDYDNLFRSLCWKELTISVENPDTKKPQDQEVSDLQEEKTLNENEELVDAIDSDRTNDQETTAKSSDESSDVKSELSKSELEKEKRKKRRGSDLSFLEQWGWHKNRRHSRKKSATIEPVEQQQETSIAAFLKRVFSKYYQITFNPNESLFESEEIIVEDKERSASFKTPPTGKDDDFQRLTSGEFQKFLNEFEYFDLIPMLKKWIEYISRFWNQNVPSRICEQYVKIFEFYLNHYEFHMWSQMEYEEFQSVYWMSLFYIEQLHETAVSKKLNKSELGEDYRLVLNQLMLHSGFYCLHSDTEYLTRMCRYHWAQYVIWKLENNLEQALDALQHIEIILNRHTEKVSVKLPSKKEDNLIERDVIEALIKSLKRTISLNNVGNLYKACKYRDLVTILKDSLINSTTIKNADNTTMKIQTQFEVLLECLWNLEDFEGCFVWTERCLKYCVDIFETIPEHSYRLKEWGESINFILIYVDALVRKHGVEILMVLGKYESRVIQSLVRIVINQLDSPVDKNDPEMHTVNLKIPWIILYLVRQRDEVSNFPFIGVDANENSQTDDDDEQIPKSFLLLFTAHEYLGRKSWCTKDDGELLLYTLNCVVPILRTPLLEPYRDLVNEYLEQITYCLYSYPPKKGRSRHIEEHEANQTELTWDKAVVLFDIYRPDNLPEFDSYKMDSITLDTEQLLQKILTLIPKNLDLSESSNVIREYIKGVSIELPETIVSNFPHRIASIFYLIADYHFKNRDFTKPTKFYVLDLTLHPWRFDSWAGLALSKATKAETKINSCGSFKAEDFLVNSENAIRCFEKCIKLRDKHTMLWIEFGSFAYMLHSYCSRILKQASETLSMEAFEFMENYKEKFLKISYNCFHTVDLYLEAADKKNDDESHDEKWLYHYMLGKVAEKKKESPIAYLEHYLKASKYIYECNATYPIRINHSNPQNLSIEALDIFYRITSSIIKYLEQHEEVSRDIGKCFERILRELATSPFAYNKAKLDNNSINALKRKMANQEQQAESATEEKEEGKEEKVSVENPDNVLAKKAKLEDGLPASPTTRRCSQESTATSVTTTTTSRTTTTSSTSSSSSSSDSDDSPDSDDETSNLPLNERELEIIYTNCVKNFEEVLARFPEHYKSINRLVHHFVYAPQKMKDLKKARELLLGTYITTLGNKIQGLFTDRKANNFFSGIWRIPSSEIDRPGSFASHLSKGVILLMEVLRESSDYEVLFELATQLFKPPDTDKKYIKDSERKELLQQALSFCCQAFRNALKKFSVPNRCDDELFGFLLEVYKIYRKSIKQLPGKESQFAPILIDCYKLFVENRVTRLPESLNLLDLASKLCVAEINRRKNLERVAPNVVHLPGIPPILLNQGKSESSFDGIGIPSLPKQTTISMSALSEGNMAKPNVGPVKNVNINPGRPRGRPAGSKNLSTQAQLAPGNTTKSFMDSSLSNISNIMAMYSNPSLYNDPNTLNNILAEYYKLALASPSPFTSTSSSPLQSSLNLPSATNIFPAPAPHQQMVSAPKQVPAKQLQAVSSQNKVPAPPKSIPKIDMKSLIASAASNILNDNPSQTKKTSSTISLGGGELTITPAKLKPSDQKSVQFSDDLKKPFIPDLPKSLSITPSPAASAMSKPNSGMVSSGKQNQMTMKPVNKPNTNKPKANQKSAMNQSALSVNPMAMMQQQQGANDYNMMLKSFSDAYLQMLKQNPQIPQQQQQPRPKKRQQQPKQQQRFQNNPNLGQAGPSGMGNFRATLQQQAPTVSNPNFAIPNSVRFQTQPNVSFIPQPSVQSAAAAGGGTKTLQQKLAERQKANSMMEQSTSSSLPVPRKKPKKSNDVIILD